MYLKLKILENNHKNVQYQLSYSISLSTSDIRRHTYNISNILKTDFISVHCLEIYYVLLTFCSPTPHEMQAQQNKLI